MQAIDVLPAKELVLSGGLDCYAKIWNKKKELLREIKFPEKVYAACFLNEYGDILVGHHGKVSTVRAADYAPEEIKKLAQPPLDELQRFYRSRGHLADRKRFAHLKEKDDEIKK